MEKMQQSDGGDAQGKVWRRGGSSAPSLGGATRPASPRGHRPASSPDPQRFLWRFHYGGKTDKIVGYWDNTHFTFNCSYHLGNSKGFSSSVPGTGGRTKYIYVCICYCCSVAQSCPTLCDPMDCSTSGLLVLHHLRSLLKLMSIELVMPSNHLILCRPLLLLPSIFPSIRVFSNESALWIRWPKYWSFSFSISPSNEYSRLISFRIDWFDLLAVQGTLKSLLQHHSSKNHSFDYMDQYLSYNKSEYRDFSSCPGVRTQCKGSRSDP